MSEKELDENLENTNEENVNDPLEVKDGIKYETNDDWEFEAKAPSLDDINVKNDEFEIDLDQEVVRSLPNKKQKIIEPSQNPDQIVIDRDLFKWIFVTIIVVLMTILITILGVKYYNDPDWSKGKIVTPGETSVTVDGTNVSIGMFNYYYNSMVSYYEQYASSGYYDLDTTKSFDKQTTTNDDGKTVTWTEFFKEETLEEIEQIQIYYNKAVKAGIGLTSAQKETIDSQISSLTSTANTNSQTVNEYISENFGEYCTEETLRLMLKQYYIVQNYKGLYPTLVKVTDSQISKYFKENKSDFETVSFSYLAFQYDTSDESAQKEAQSEADKYLKKMSDEDSIKKLAKEVYADYIKTESESIKSQDSSITDKEALKQATEEYTSNVTYSFEGSNSPFDEDFTKWLMSDDTKVGDKDTYDDGNGYIYAVVKTELAKADTEKTYTVRHILIQPESSSSSSSSSSSETTYTKKEWAAAKKKANNILKKYKNGDKTEKSFALLAEKYSSDTGSTSSGSSSSGTSSFGGIYEGITSGEMVKSFENWANDKSRKYGDVEIVKSDYGYHIMYFVNNNYPKYKVEVKDAIINEALNQMIKDAKIKVRNKNVNKQVDAANKKALASATSSSSSSSETTSVETTSETESTTETTSK